MRVSVDGATQADAIDDVFGTQMEHMARANASLMEHMVRANARLEGLSDELLHTKLKLSEVESHWEIATSEIIESKMTLDG